jgi:hypothetical protein
MNFSYIAGFIDGEGTIRFQRTGKYRRLQPMVSVTNTHKGILDEIASFLGYGTVIFCKANNPRSKDYYHLLITGTERLGHLLDGIFTHLVIKKEQAKLMLVLLNRTTFDHKALSQEELDFRERLDTEMRSLNKRGRKNANVDGRSEGFVQATSAR